MAGKYAPTADPYFLKLPKLDTFDDVVKYQSRMIQAQHKSIVPIERHRVINGSCQIILKAHELKGNIDRIIELEERLDSIVGEDSKGRRKKRKKLKGKLQKQGIPGDKPKK